MTGYEIRQKARATIEKDFLISILCGAVATGLGGLLTGAAVTFSFQYNTSFQYNVDTASISEFPHILFAVFGIIFCYIVVYGIVYSFLRGTVQLGYAQFLLKQQDGADYGPMDMFSQFYRVKEGFWQIFLRELYTTLWTLLFIVPGIVKSYSYAMTPFIMAEHPEMTAKEAIRASQVLMKGHKADLFCLDLSFIGWGFASAFALNGHYVIHPYKNTAYAIFYRSISRPVYSTEVIEE